MAGSGMNGIRDALKATQQIIGIEASNLVRSQIPGAQEVRATLSNNNTVQLGNGKQAGAAGGSISATTLAFNQGSIRATGFTTDLAINGSGFFILQASNQQLYYTRRGDFHFDASGQLVNNDGLKVMSLNPSTGKLEPMTVEVSPTTTENGARILDLLRENDSLSAADIETALGLPPATVNAEIGILQASEYIVTFNQAGVTRYASNLGQVGDQVDFDRDGFLVNQTRGLRKGNQLALAVFPNPQGLSPTQFGGEVYKTTDAAAPGGVPDIGGPGDIGLDLGSIQSQALESSTSDVPNSLTAMGIWQRNFTATTAALKTFLAAWDDLVNTFRAA
jgi:flagellar hook-basal body protein